MRLAPSSEKDRIRFVAVALAAWLFVILLPTIYVLKHFANTPTGPAEATEALPAPIPLEVVIVALKTKGATELQQENYFASIQGREVVFSGTVNQVSATLWGVPEANISSGASAVGTEAAPAARQVFSRLRLGQAVTVRARLKSYWIGWFSGPHFTVHEATVTTGR